MSYGTVTEPAPSRVVLDVGRAARSVTIFLPAILILIAALAFITRIIDRAEDRRRSDGHGPGRAR